MKLSRIAAVTLARSIEFVRDSATLGWNLAFPLLLVAGFAWIFSGPPQPLFKVAVLLPEGVRLEQASHPVAAAPGVQYYQEFDLAAARAKVARHRIELLLDFRTRPGSYYVNPASTKGAAAEAVLLGVGGTGGAVRQAESGGGFRYVDWAAPGVLGLNLMFSCLFGVGYVIVRYRKSGYLKRLNATPLSAGEFIVAQLVSRLVLTLAVTSIVYTGCNLFLHFRMEGSYLTLLLVAAVGSFSMIALGLMVAARITSEELSGGVLNMISWPMMVLCGAFFSLDGTPRPVQLASQAFPLTHLLSAARAIMLDGATLASVEVLRPLVILAAMAASFTALGAWGFKWTQD